MAKYSIVTKIADGSSNQFSISFSDGFIQREYISCRVNLETDTNGDPVYRSIIWINDGLVQIGGAIPAAGEKVVFTRATPIAAAINDFQNGSVLTDTTLDTGFRQMVHAMQEVNDRTENIATMEAIDDAVAVALGYSNNAALQSVAAAGHSANAQAYANQASGHANTASGHASTALTHRNNASSSATAASNSASAAASSANAAANSAASAPDTEYFGAFNQAVTGAARPLLNWTSGGTTLLEFNYVQLWRVGNMVHATLRLVESTSFNVTFPNDSSITCTFDMEAMLTQCGFSTDNVTNTTYGNAVAHIGGTGIDLPNHPFAFGLSSNGSATISASDFTHFPNQVATGFDLRMFINFRVALP